jgi:hypothetical protein
MRDQVSHPYKTTGITAHGMQIQHMCLLEYVPRYRDKFAFTFSSTLKLRAVYSSETLTHSHNTSRRIVLKMEAVCSSDTLAYTQKYFTAHSSEDGDSMFLRTVGIHPKILHGGIALKMEAVCSSETLANHHHLPSHRLEKFLRLSLKQV